MQRQIVLASKGIVLHEGTVLLIKRSSYDGICPGMWEFPGGKLEFGEDPEDCMRREIQEEAGLLSFEVDRLLYASSFLTAPCRQAVILTYLCFSRDSQVRLSDEHTDFQWVAKERLADILNKDVMAGLIRHGVEKMI